jgi:hypothetical protein
VTEVYVVPVFEYPVLTFVDRRVAVAAGSGTEFTNDPADWYPTGK